MLLRYVSINGFYGVRGLLKQVVLRRYSALSEHHFRNIMFHQGSKLKGTNGTLILSLHCLFFYHLTTAHKLW